jgi:hypothetical protein
LQIAIWVRYGLGIVEFHRPAALLAPLAQLAGKVRRAEIIQALWIAAFVLFVRVVSLLMVANPDAARKWGAARALLHGDSLARFDHHTARWAINVPVLLVQVVFGDGAIVHYFPTLLFCVLHAWLTLGIGKQLGGTAVGVFAVLLTTLLPAMRFAGSHLLPTVFESTYVLAALYCLLRAGSTGGVAWLCASCLGMCAAYFAKETTVFFLPGLAAGVWLGRRSWRQAAAYVAGFGACVALETLVYRVTLGVPLGRLSIVQRYHFSVEKLKQPITSVADLLGRYLEFRFGFRELFYAALAVSLVLVVCSFRARRLPHVALTSTWLSAWGFILANTFALKSLTPPRLAQPLNERYLHAAAPLFALLVAWAVVRAWRWVGVRGWAGVRGRASAWRLARGGRLPAWLTRALCAACAAWVYIADWPGFAAHPFVRTKQAESLIQEAFERGLPIGSTDARHNSTTLSGAIFLTQAQLRNSVLVRPMRKGQRQHVLVNEDAAPYRGLSRRELTERLRDFRSGPHVLVSTAGGAFTARLRQ